MFEVYDSSADWVTQAKTTLRSRVHAAMANKAAEEADRSPVPKVISSLLSLRGVGRELHLHEGFAWA